MDKVHKVSRVMTSNLILLNPEDSLEKAIGLFSKYDIRHLPVVSNNEVKGILSKTDIERLCFGFPDYSLEESLLLPLKVDQVMKHNVVCILEDESIYDASKKLADEDFHAFPVINAQNKLTGILTTTDVINFLLTHSNKIV